MLCVGSHSAHHLYKVTPAISYALAGLKILGQHTIENFALK